MTRTLKDVKLSDEKLAEVRAHAARAVFRAMAELKPGDRISRKICGGAKGHFIFTHWDGNIACGRSIRDCHPATIYKVNGRPVDFGEDPSPRYTTPEQPGFYWAKWKIDDEGTRDGDELTPSDRWEVVEVCENGGDDPRNYLRVSVSGVEMSQSIENFFWGPGPLLADEEATIISMIATQAVRARKEGII